MTWADRAAHYGGDHVCNRQRSGVFRLVGPPLLHPDMRRAGAGHAESRKAGQLILIKEGNGDNMVNSLLWNMLMGARLSHSGGGGGFIWPQRGRLAG